MPLLSLRMAVKHFEVSRPTLLKDLREGKISAGKDAKGNWMIDPSEIARVYQARGEKAPKAGQGGPSEPPGGQPPPKGDTRPQDEAQRRIAALEAEIELERAKRAAAEEMAEERGRHLEDLRRLLPKPSDPPQRPSFWRFFRA